ncbi:MAG: hypothetical protein IJE53_01310 [Bacilli bacterium]|nr:hypothetical protein [Bacilli bacterium]
MSLIKCKKISVDCIKNDPVDKRAGGADILGYDFFVDQKEATELVGVIKATIEELKLPLMGINILEDQTYSLSEEKVWRKERIIECIINESAVIKAEAEHQAFYKKA